MWQSNANVSKPGLNCSRILEMNPNLFWSVTKCYKCVVIFSKVVLSIKNGSKTNRKDGKVLQIYLMLV